MGAQQETSTEEGAETTETNEGQQQQPPPKTAFVGSATGQSLAASGDPGAASPDEENLESGEGDDTTTEGGEGEGKDGKVVGHGGKPMSQEAIAERTQRAIRANQRKLFGTTDEEEIKKIIERGKAKGNVMSDDQQKEYERLKRLEESRQRARMTAEQRRAKELEERDAQIAELKEQLKERDTQEAVRKQDAVITEAASPYIDDKYMKHARRDLGAHLLELQKEKPEQFAKFGPTQLKRWFEKYAQDYPAFAKQQEETTTTTTTEGGDGDGKPATTSTPSRPVRRPVTTTGKQARPPAPAPKDGPGMFKGKTVKPGQPNSMTKAELREYMKSQGRKLNY